MQAVHRPVLFARRQAPACGHDRVRAGHPQSADRVRSDCPAIGSSHGADIPQGGGKWHPQVRHLADLDVPVDQRNQPSGAWSSFAPFPSYPLRSSLLHSLRFLIISPSLSRTALPAPFGSYPLRSATPASCYGCRVTGLRDRSGRTSGAFPTESDFRRPMPLIKGDRIKMKRKVLRLIEGDRIEMRAAGTPVERRGYGHHEAERGHPLNEGDKFEMRPKERPECQG